MRSDADLLEIKSAFRRLAREYHPDKNKDPEAEQKFNQVTEAYSTIMSSHGVPVGTRVEAPPDSPAEEGGGKLSFTIFTDKEVIHSVSPKLFEQEVRKRFNPGLAPGTSIKIGKTWFEIELEASNTIPLLSSRLGKHKILIEWYKDKDGNDKMKPISWDAFWSYVRRCVTLATM